MNPPGMNPFDYTKAFADFWKTQSQALMQAQEKAGKAMVDGMQALAAGKLPTMPDLSIDLSASASDLSRASQAVSALWSAATALSGSLAKLSPNLATPGDTTVEATFRKMVDPRAWLAGTGEVDEVLGRMVEGPRFADLWDIERRYLHVLHAWMIVRRRGLEHNAVVLETWLNAGRKFNEELAGRTQTDGQGAGEAAKEAPGGKELLALWTETANRQLLEMQHSEPFLKTQAAMIRATTDLCMAQHELVEHFGKQYGFPTRSELDDVYRTVTDLRREMRALRREQRESSRSTGASTNPVMVGGQDRPPTSLSGAAPQDVGGRASPTMTGGATVSPPELPAAPPPSAEASSPKPVARRPAVRKRGTH